jgi:EmrB/QacA subfamily drug resistance transporter
MQLTLAPSSAKTDRRRWIALVVVCLAMLMNALDSSIVNVALPSIQRSLRFSPANLTWVVDAYLIAFGSFLLLAGRLGDLIGRKKIFLFGVALFSAASAVCAVASSQAMLIAARFVQGVGGAVSTSVIVAIIVTEFPGAAERAKAMSLFLFVAVGGGSIGLLVGGLLTQAVNWHWIFVINIPIGLVTLLLGSALIKENEGLGVGHGVDVTGSLLMTLSLVVGIYALVTASSRGWLSPHTLGFAGAALAGAVAFLLVESRVAAPIMPLRILRLRTLTASSIVRGLIFSSVSAVFFFGALDLERVLGYGPLATGVAFLPMTLIMATMSLGVTSRLMVRFGAMRLLIPGMGLVLIGLLALSRASASAGYVTGILPSLLALGLGISLSVVPLLTIAMGDVPTEDAGLASGIVNVSMWLAASAVLAVFGSLAASRSRQALAQGQGVRDALVAGYHETFLVGGVLAAAAIVVTLLVLWTPPRAREVAETTDRPRDGEWDLDLSMSEC